MDERRLYVKPPSDWATMTDADKARWSADVLERLRAPSGDPERPDAGEPQPGT